MSYAVLRPIYAAQGDGYIVRWEKLGTASSMEEAKKRFGGHPVLEAIK